MKFDVRVNFQKTQKELNAVKDKRYPKAVARATSVLTTKAAELIRQRTRNAFDLKSDWIPRGIRSFPYGNQQINRAAQEYRMRGNIVGSVRTPKQQDFMRGHEHGATRTRHHRGGKKQFEFDTTGLLAVPGSFLKNKGKGWKGSRGYGVNKKWRPGTLISKMSKTPRIKTNSRALKPFFMKNKKGNPMIVRRNGIGKKGQIEVLYNYIPQAKIAPNWEFKETADKYVRRAYKHTLVKEWRRMERGR